MKLAELSLKLFSIIHNYYNAIIENQKYIIVSSLKMIWTLYDPIYIIGAKSS